MEFISKSDTNFLIKQVEIEGKTRPCLAKFPYQCEKGSKVSTGETLIFPVMKMEHAIKANSDGVVSNLYVSAEIRLRVVQPNEVVDMSDSL